VKTCPLCNHSLRVTNSRDIGNLHAKHHKDRCIREAGAQGITQGIIRERRCDNCKALLYTHEVMFHLDKPNTKGKNNHD
jgi:transcriptional regulator NrdR family protein